LSPERPGTIATLSVISRASTRERLPSWVIRISYECLWVTCEDHQRSSEAGSGVDECETATRSRARLVPHNLHCPSRTTLKDDSAPHGTLPITAYPCNHRYAFLSPMLACRCAYDTRSQTLISSHSCVYTIAGSSCASRPSLPIESPRFRSQLIDSAASAAAAAPSPMSSQSPVYWRSSLVISGP